jgi:SAM-dependent methyltransferase
MSSMVNTSQKRSSLAEKLLLLLSRRPQAFDYDEGRDHWESRDPLSELCRYFPDFHTAIIGKEILDFGCGTGYQSVALAQMRAKHVVGLDTNPTHLEKGRELARELGLQEQVEFTDKFAEAFEGRFDIAISQNSMEHFTDPLGALNAMKAALKDSGGILMTFGCPWFSPYGSHMHFFVKVPWVNILFSEKTVMNVRSMFRNDGARRYEEVESGLNKMTIAKFERLLHECGLRVGYKRYDCVRGLNFAAKLPLVRELLINHVSCILMKG